MYRDSKDQEPLDPTALLSLKQGLQSYLRQELTLIFELYFEDAAAHLVDLAQRAENNQRHLAVLEALGIFKRSRPLLVSGLVEGIVRLEPQSLPVTQPSVEKAGTEQLQLLDLQELDVQLALTGLITAGVERWSPLLYGLIQRWNFLRGHDGDGEDYPLAVGPLCRRLYDALLVTGIESEFLKELLRAARMSLLPRLGDIYDGVNERLKRAGVLPTLEISRWPELQRMRQQTRVREMEMLAVPPALPSANEVNTPALATSVPVSNPGSGITREVYQAARKLLQLVQGGWNARASAPSRTASPAELRQGLVALAATAEPSDGALLEQLQEYFAQHAPGAAIAADDAVQIQISERIVGELAGLLRDTPKLLTVVQELQLPLAVKALAQPQLFDEPAHPANQLVNAMGALCLQSPAGVHPLEDRISGILQPLLAGGHVDDHQFATAAKELDGVGEQQRKQRERSIQRLISVCEGQQKLSMAQSAVDRELRRRLAHVELPQLVVNLVESAWRELLRLIYLRVGESSHEWVESIALLEELLWSFDEAVHIGESRRGDVQWLKSTQALIDRIQSRLNAYFPHDYRHATLADRIRAALQGEHPVEMASTAFELPTREYANRGMLLAELDEAYPDLMRWFRRAREFKVEDIFCHLKDPQKRLHTLVWIGNDAQHFVFVNSQGNKSYDFDLVDFARELATGLYPVDQAAATSVVERAMFNSAQSAYEDIAAHHARDELTGLLNRRSFEVQIETALLQVRAGQGRCSLLYANVDQFALFNDLHGHAEGDRLLQEVGVLLSTEAGAAIVARVAGNEFALLVRDNMDVARALAEKLREAVARKSWQVNAATADLTISIGLLEISKFSESVNNLIRDVAYACAQAKEQGRDRVYVLDDNVDILARRDRLLGWINKLNAVMAGDTLLLRAQPIVPTANTQDVCHYEILLGLRGEDDSVLPPGDFIEAAECYNRMQRIDRWVIDHAFAWLRRQQMQGADLPTLSINLSANSINDGALLDFIIDRFGSYGISPHLICFEVTETATIDNLANAADFIRRAKRLGCKFALDDFGTGRSSYEYLKQLPVDYLKIDGVFIVNVNTDRGDYLMVKSIHEIACAMGIKTIAEFVENDDIVATLREIGVDYVQGYAVGRPIVLA